MFFRSKNVLFILTFGTFRFADYTIEGEIIEDINFRNLSNEQKERIYKIVSFTKGRIYGIPNRVAVSIVNKMEYTQLNKIEFIKEKEICIKLKVDRLGNLSKAGV